MAAKRHTRRRTYLSGALALTLFAAACGSDTSPGTASSEPAQNGDVETVTVDDLDIQLTSGLATFDTCSSLLTHLQTEGAERVGAFGFNSGGYFFGDVEEAMEDVEAMEDEEASFDTVSDAASDVAEFAFDDAGTVTTAQGSDGCLLYTSPSPRDS